MRPRIGILIAGVIWGFGGLYLRSLSGFGMSLDALPLTPLHSMFLDAAGTGHWMGPFMLLLLPVGLGIDLLIWTVGVAAWVLQPGASWPGAALGHLIAAHPSLSSVGVGVASVLGGIILSAVATLLYQSTFGRLPSQPR